jgi:hypothetical protein
MIPNKSPLFMVFYFLLSSFRRRLSQDFHFDFLARRHAMHEVILVKDLAGISSLTVENVAIVRLSRLFPAL